MMSNNELPARVEPPIEMMSASGAIPCTASTSSRFSTMPMFGGCGGEPSKVGIRLSCPGRSWGVPTLADHVFTSSSNVSDEGVITATTCPAPVSRASSTPWNRRSCVGV